MDTGLSGTTALVTGASGGIGLATARRFADEGAGLVLHYHTNRSPLEALGREIDVPHVIGGADLRDEAAVDRLFAEALGAFPRLDTLVVNAGIWNGRTTPLHEMELDQWNATFDADLVSAFLSCRAFLRHLAAVPRPTASIVLVGSTAAIFGEAGHADYAAAKSGMVYGLALSLKNEIVRLAERGRVNSVCPGWTDTPMAAGTASDPAALRRVTSTMPLRKIATPDDVAGAIVYLASDRLAGHVSGEIVTVAGGMEGRLQHGELVG